TRSSRGWSSDVCSSDLDAAGASSIHAGTADVIVGGDSGLTGFSLLGSVAWLEIRDGIDGTVVANPDFTAQEPGATSFVDTKGREIGRASCRESVELVGI